MGCWDSYCFICGTIATGENINIDEEYQIEILKKYIKEGSYPIPLKTGLSKTKRAIITPKLLKSYKNYINDLKKIEVKWLQDIIVISKDKIINGDKLKYSCSGTFESKKKKKNKYKRISSEFVYDITKGNWGWTYEHDMIQGLVCHKNCYLLLCKQFKKKFKFEQFHPYLNEYSLLNKYGPIINQYVGSQIFDFHDYLNNNSSMIEKSLLLNKEFKIVKKNLNYLLDPLKNKENADRIFKLWIPIIKKFKPIKLRPSPSDSATLYKIGLKQKGNDGNMYIIVTNKNGVKRWQQF